MRVLKGFLRSLLVDIVHGIGPTLHATINWNFYIVCEFLQRFSIFLQKIPKFSTERSKSTRLNGFFLDSSPRENWIMKQPRLSGLPESRIHLFTWPESVPKPLCTPSSIYRLSPCNVTFEYSYIRRYKIFQMSGNKIRWKIKVAKNRRNCSSALLSPYSLR